MSSDFNYPPITEAQFLLGTSHKMILAVEGHKIPSEETLTDIILGTYTKQDFLNSKLGVVFSSKSIV